jgi:hypothetical protein
MKIESEMRVMVSRLQEGSELLGIFAVSEYAGGLGRAAILVEPQIQLRQEL